MPESVMERKAFAISDWSTCFENSASLKIKRPSWIPIPNKHDGKGFGRIAVQDDAPDILAAWILIAEVASRCPIRGILADDDGPLDADDLAVKTRFPTRIFTRALEFLTTPKIAWITTTAWPIDPGLVEDVADHKGNLTGVRLYRGPGGGSRAPSAKIPQVPARKPAQSARRTEGNRIEGNRIEKKVVVDSIPSDLGTRNHDCFPLEDSVYEKYPDLKILHFETPFLRGLTFEQYLRARQARSPFLDYVAAAKEISRRAELDGNIAKPGRYLDSQLSYWEKDHAEIIGRKKAEHARASEAFEDIVSFLVEVGGPDTGPGSRQMEHFTTGRPEGYRQKVLAEYEKRVEAGAGRGNG